MGHLLDFQSHDKAPRSLTLTDTCSEGKIPSENQACCYTTHDNVLGSPTVCSNEGALFLLPSPPTNGKPLERTSLEPWQNRGPGRIQVQVQQRHDDQKHQPDHPSISHALPLLPLACHTATGA